MPPRAAKSLARSPSSLLSPSLVRTLPALAYHAAPFTGAPSFANLPTDLSAIATAKADRPQLTSFPPTTSAVFASFKAHKQHIKTFLFFYFRTLVIKLAYGTIDSSPNFCFALRNSPRPLPLIRALCVNSVPSFACKLSAIGSQPLPKPFRMNTSKSVTKQRTLNTFRINTYAKTGGGGRAIHLAQQKIFLQCFEANSLTIKYIAAKPASRTPLSSNTETRCSFRNASSNGLLAAVASIDPIRTRSAAIRGVTANCEISVSAIINTTHSAAGAAKLANVRVRTNRTNRITTPQAMPIKCIRVSEYPTTAPASSRLARIANAPGATTKLKKISLPSHTLRPRNSIARRTVDMIGFG
jgi:hypothetical protein